jgi:preprotein translocase subunit SecF
VVLPRLFIDLQRGRHCSMGWHWAHPVGVSPVPLGVDFRGGTEVQVQFAQPPDINAIRQAMDAAGIKDASVVQPTTSARSTRC